MTGHLDLFVARNRAEHKLVVQPRMGFGWPAKLRAGLAAVAALDVPVVGTITIDSYTRVGDYLTPLQQLAAGAELNGYPLVSHPIAQTRAMIAGLHGPDFPIQVRHGTSRPLKVFKRLVAVGLDATEGGPVSYCLPYGRVPLSSAITAWADGCRFLAAETERGHIESFGGCLLGQLCPPSLLVAMTVLEGCFFRQHGLRRMSLSFAQGTLGAQDRGALRALRTLARLHLEDVVWHVVLYSYMGVFPRTPGGAAEIIRESARIARDTGCERLIVKTVAESRQIPTIEDNVVALELAAAAALGAAQPQTALEESFYQEVLEEARLIVDCVLNLAPDVGAAFALAFKLGVLDVPFCPHPDNQAAATCVIDERGAMVWADRGGLPLPASSSRAGRQARIGSEQFRDMLFLIADRYDAAAELGAGPAVSAEEQAR